MQALVFTAAGRVELRAEPEPRAADGHVLVRVQASAICGSELHGFYSTTFRKPPLIMGHEFAGTTPDGARVVINPLLSCGDCPGCRQGNPQVCRERGLIGVSRDGGFAETVSVPHGSLHVLPDDLSWSAATLIEPLANAVHAWSLVAEIPDRVAVIGAGPIGLVCGLVARAAGADVTLYETAAGRRLVAEKLGFAVAAELVDEEYAAIIDAVGLSQTRHSSMRHCAPAGTAIWLGLAADSVSFSGNDLVRAEKRIVGSFAYRPDEFAVAVSLASSLDLSWTTEVPLADAEETFYALAEGRSEIVKAVLVPGGLA